MNEKTAAALEKSIAKWERNTEIESLAHAKTGWKDCDLCQLFLNADCEGCPVKIRSGKAWCRGTPYRRAFGKVSGGDLPGFIKAAKAEVKFLKSLRAK